MKFLFSFFFFLFLISCGGDSSKNEAKNLTTDSLINTAISNGEPKIIEPVVDEKIELLTNNGISLTEIKAENNKNASIRLNTKQFTEGNNQLQFSVEGVDEFKISYLANNYSLTQFAATTIKVELLYGNNVFLAFLTDKYNISIKTNKGSVLKNVVLGPDVASLFEMNRPHLFYYLPQTETVNPILDFYLVNTSIAENGNQVKATINGTEFLIKKWAAYQISGLKKQKNTIRIQLLDKNGKIIDGPFNDSGERSFSLINKQV